MTSGARDTQPIQPEHAVVVANENAMGPLDEARFNAAVHEALRHYLEPDCLRGNPLLWSRLVEAEAGGDRQPARRVQALRHIIDTQARRFQAAPKTVILARVLTAAYFRPAVSQTTAAIQLGISARTFRRHRKRAVALLGAWLWETELEYQSRHPPPQ